MTTKSDHYHALFENLLKRQFAVQKMNQAYVSDLTSVRTEEGWLYLSIVIDLYSRKVVSWSMGSRMKTKLVIDTLLMAIWKYSPPKGLIVHSDRGSQYASYSYKKLLKKYNFVGSMSRKGDCLRQRRC